ncbi:MAG: PhoX family phosphatase [Rhodobacteraceae bacterium]|nr:PhoX family phosphatase [Paracoccaceae bacterium]
MKDYESDYPDFRQTPFYEHGDEVPSNRSANPTMYDVVAARTSRRGFLVGGLAGIATGLFGGGLTPRAALAQSAAPSGLLGFAAVPLSKDDTVVVPAGYTVQVLAPWGTPLLADAPAYAPGVSTGAGQALQVGSHHDGMHFFAIDGSSTDGLLVMNHEYIEPRFMHAVKWAGQALDGDTVVFDANGKRDDDEVLAELNAHGCTVARVQRGADGQWSVVQGDPMNRRVTGLTEMRIAGPAAGSPHLVTRFAPDGLRTRGTLNNCAHGVTPWNTYMTAEENWAGYFVNASAEMPREQARYGVSEEESRYGWEKAAGGADAYIRFNAAATGASAAEDYRNETNTFGWMVEFDPFDPASVPVKRTHLGRFAHEGVVFAPAVAGQPVVCYSGDDSRFEYIYKYVSTAAYDPATANGDLLDNGTLYVARFNADGTGEWLALAPGENGLTPENGFADLADILVNTRLAADQAGATKMDRPEWGTVDPNSGEVYFTLTNNNRRDLTQVDAVNPRAENNFGQIVRWKYEGNDHTATSFAWELFVIAGTPRQSKTFGGDVLGDDNTFACPDGIWCDANSRLWIQTDMGDIGPAQEGPLAPFGMNMMLAADPATGEIRRFLTGPWGQEITGVVTTPDGTTMFVNVQHPGGHATAEDFAAGNFGSGFPDYNGTVPRSATLVIARTDGGVIGA